MVIMCAHYLKQSGKVTCVWWHSNDIVTVREKDARVLLVPPPPSKTALGTTKITRAQSLVREVVVNATLTALVFHFVFHMVIMVVTPTRSLTMGNVWFYHGKQSW